MRTTIERWLALVACSATCATVLAAAPAPAPAPVVNVTAPWVRATVPAQKATGAFMYLLAPKGAKLVGVSTPVAARSELHHMMMDGDMMKMRQVEAIDLPAGKGINLASGSYHIMLMGLKRRLKDGETVDLTLDLVDANKKRSTTTVKVPVKPMGFVSPGAASAPMAH